LCCERHTINELELFSLVALIRDLPDHGLVCGQVGTVVELYSPAMAEVEFSDAQGRTYAMAALSLKDCMVLHHNAVALVA
jgi:hypothetical protein